MGNTNRDKRNFWRKNERLSEPLWPFYQINFTLFDFIPAHGQGPLPVKLVNRPRSGVTPDPKRTAPRSQLRPDDADDNGHHSGRETRWCRDWWWFFKSSPQVREFGPRPRCFFCLENLSCPMGEWRLKTNGKGRRPPLFQSFIIDGNRYFLKCILFHIFLI